VKYPPADGPTGSDPGRIEWTEATWNPVTGCTKVSPGCKHGYAEHLAKRLKAMGSPRYRNGFKVTGSMPPYSGVREGCGITT